MLIAQIPAATANVTPQRYESPISKMGIYVDVNTSIYGNVAIGMEQLKVALNNGATRIKSYIQDKTSTKTLHNDLPLLDLVEFSSSNEGTIGFEVITVGGVPHNRYMCTIELSETSAIKFGDDANFYVSISNKNTNTPMELHAIDHPIEGTEYIKYESFAIQTNDSGKKFDVTDKTNICVPRDYISQLELTYTSPNGQKTCVFTKDDLKFITNDTNELVNVSPMWTRSGGYRWSVIDVSHCTNAVVKLEQSTPNDLQQIYLTELENITLR